MRTLTGKVAVVTGAGSGIGRATALRLGQAGMSIVAADLDAAPLEALGREFVAQSTPYVLVPADVSHLTAVERIRAAALEAWGAVHVVHNNAGVSLPAMPAWDVPVELWEWLLGVNLMGVVHGVRTFVPDLVTQGEGHVVITASLGGITASGRRAPYCAAKHGVVAIGETLAADLAEIGSPVGVSIVCPALVPTNLRATSERHRPVIVGHPEEAKPYHGRVQSSSVSAEAVADAIHDGIVENKLFVMTHADVRDVVKERFAAILDAF
jgi:NAD(P)-dependent dehydrogenase (short-subunit alcohol dehydrogenase family)